MTRAIRSFEYAMTVLAICLGSCKVPEPGSDAQSSSGDTAQRPHVSIVQPSTTRRDLLGIWEGKISFKTEGAPWHAHVSFEVSSDTDPSASTFRVSFPDEHSNFIKGDIDSITFVGDTVRLYCHVLYDVGGYLARGVAKDYQLVFTGTPIDAEPANVRILTGTIAASGTDPAVELFNPPNRDRFVSYGFPQWEFTDDPAVSRTRSSRSVATMTIDTDTSSVSRAALLVSERDLVGQWKGDWESEMLEGKEMISLDMEPDTVDWPSRLAFWTPYEPGPSRSFYCEVDSTRLNGDTVRLYCHVTKIGTGDGSTYPRNFRVVLVGRYFRDATKAMHILAGTIEASGRDPIVKAFTHPYRSRFAVYRVDPWAEYQASASVTARD